MAAGPEIAAHDHVRHTIYKIIINFQELYLDYYEVHYEVGRISDS